MAPSTSIFTMFACSPIRPLQVHMSKVQACVDRLPEFFKAVLDSDWETAAALQAEIVKLEQAADEIKRSLRLQLPTELFLSVPRTDILELITAQDTIANRAKDIAGLICGRRMQIPIELADPMIGLLSRSIEASAQANKAIHELSELLGSGFGGKAANLLSQIIEELNKIEHQTDEMEAKVRSLLYRLEKDLLPVDVVFLYKIIEWMGDLADCSQELGGRLQLLVSR